MKQMVALFLCLAMLLLLPACHAPDTETPGTTPPRESVTAPTGENASESRNRVRHWSPQPEPNPEPKPGLRRNPRPNP